MLRLSSDSERCLTRLYAFKGLNCPFFATYACRCNDPNNLKE